MKYQSLGEETKIRKAGYKTVAGLDEAGRGPLAGPVVACAVCVKPGLVNKPDLVIRDSKKMSFSQREKAFKFLTKNSFIDFGVSKASEKVIDRINILEATKLAMQKAVGKLRKKPDFLILDGNFRINSKISQKPIIKADGKVFSCMAAGIIAKVTRDRIMLKYHKKYPCYGFDRHKGYPTKDHYNMLKKRGACKIHRRSFSLLNESKVHFGNSPVKHNTGSRS